MAPRSDNLGERIARLEAILSSEREYSHDRWHKLDNDLTPVVNLPERLTRDIAKMQGVFDGRMQTFRQDIERNITEAINKALEPVSEDITKLKAKVEVLESEQQQFSGARRIMVWVIQTIAAAIAAIGAIVAIGRGGH